MTQGVIAGPHSIVSQIHRDLGNNHATTRAYFEKVVRVYRNGFEAGLDASLWRPKIDELNSE